MAVGLIFVGTDVTPAPYEQVLAQACPDHQPPPGMLYHAAGLGPSGLIVIDTFASQESLDAFEHDQLRPARDAAKITAHEVTVFPLINTMQPERRWARRNVERGVGMPPVVWRLSLAESEPAVAVIARAFHDQPIFVAAVPDSTERGRLLTVLYRYGLCFGRAVGQCWAVGARVGTIDGVALVFDMPLLDLTAAQQDALGFAPIAARWHVPHEQQLQTVEAAVAAIPDLPPEGALVIMESGSLTIRVAEQGWMVSRGNAMQAAMATPNAAPELSGVVETVAQGAAAMLQAGDVAYVPGSVTGEVRNAGQEPAAALLILTDPGGSMLGQGTPTA